MEIGRRIIFDSITGKVISNSGEMQGEVLPREDIGGLDYVDYPYGYEADKFMRAKSFHIDPLTKAVVFDELYEPVLSPQEQIEDLQNQLMIAQGVI